MLHLACFAKLAKLATTVYISTINGLSSTNSQEKQPYAKSKDQVNKLVQEITQLLRSNCCQQVTAKSALFIRKFDQ